MSFFLAYPQNDSWGEIRFLSSKLTVGSFEPADQEDLVMNSPCQSKGIVSVFFVNLTHLGIHFRRDSFPISFQPIFFEQKISILRCWDNSLFPYQSSLPISFRFPLDREGVPLGNFLTKLKAHGVSLFRRRGSMWKEVEIYNLWTIIWIAWRRALEGFKVGLEANGKRVFQLRELGQR